MYTQAIASIYDKLADFDYDAWSQWYKAVFERSGLSKGAAVLDAGCGTGRLTARLHSLGFDVTGIDTSVDMLNVAAENLRREGIRAALVQMDMRHIQLHRQVKAIVSSCDGVNYLTKKEDVMLFLKSAHINLIAGGLLAFDISTEYKLSRYLGDNLFAESGEDVSYIWQNSFDSSEKLCIMDIAYFLREKELYRLYRERHVQRAHTASEIAGWLGEAGFAQVCIYHDYSFEKPAEDSMRINFTAIKA